MKAVAAVAAAALIAFCNVNTASATETAQPLLKTVLQEIYQAVNSRSPEPGPAPGGWRALLAQGVPPLEVCLVISSQIEGITKNGGMFESYKKCDQFRTRDFGSLPNEYH